MSVENKRNQVPSAREMEDRLSCWITQLHERAPESIGDLLRFRVGPCDPKAGDYSFFASTEEWMRNAFGSLHGGIIGTILTGVFASSSVNGVSGLIEGDVHQFLIQIAGTLIASAYAFAVTMLILKCVNKVLPVRVTAEEEEEGLDVSLHHEEAYHL